MEELGEQFLHQRNPRLHTTRPVEHEQKRRIRREGEKVSQKPADKIYRWLRVIEQTHMGHRDDPRVLERIKAFYHKQYVIEPEDIPKGYFDNQRRLLRERGYGDIEITTEQRAQLAETIISDQQSTLDNWVDYLSSSESDSFPTWAKYWAFTGMVKLSTYDKERHAFGKRGKGTVAPFPDLNREALACIIDAVVKKANKQIIPTEIDNSEFKKLLQGANFGKLYAYAIEKVTPAEESELQTTTGKWIKYGQNSDHMPLVKSIQGHGTGWCTAGETTAEAQLRMGDFYIYYSQDKQGHFTVPRIAIRMNGKRRIAEVRGIAHEQNLDPIIANADILDKKLQEFGQEGEKYKIRSTNMRRLTDIDNRHSRGESLTEEDLRFLYQIDSKIKGFGHREDPRIKEILSGRDNKKDLSVITGSREDQISLTKEEALSGGIKYHYGSLHLGSLTSAEGLQLPDSISGYLYLDNLTSAEGLQLPNSIGGNLYLGSLTSAEGLQLPDSIGGYLYLDSLTSAEGLQFPDSIDDDLRLDSLTSAEGLQLPDSIGDDLRLDSLTSAEGLQLPNSIGGNLRLDSLTSAEGLQLPDSIGDDLRLDSLTSAEGLQLPDSIGGDLYLDSLTSAEGLQLPDSISGNLYLDSLTSAEGLQLPGSIGGYLYLDSLTSAGKQMIGVQYPQIKIY